MLGVSMLGVDTKLGGTIRTIFNDVDLYCNPPDFDWWTLGRSTLGNTTILAPPTGGFRSEEWFFERFRAYSFQILVYDLTLTTEQRDNINRRIKQIRPARSDWILRDNMDLVGAGFTTVVNDVDEFNLINTAFKDAASTETGISGRQ